jgi:hypothetical protein
LQFEEKIAADFTLDGHGIQRKAFIAAAGADGKGGELLGVDFLPGRLAQGFERIGAKVGPAQYSRDSQVGNTGDAGEALQGFLGAGGVGNFDDEAIGGAGDAVDGDAVEGAAQGFAQLVQEKAAISPFEPQLMIVNDNLRWSNHLQLAISGACA